MNPILSDFLDGLEIRYPDDSTTMSMSQWVVQNTHLKRKHFSMVGYEFQEAIINDMHPNLACMKISQCGLTEAQMRKAAGFVTRNTGVKAIFTLPNDKMRDRLSQTRFKPLIESEMAFNTGISFDKPVRHKGLYQIADSFLYVTGSTEGDATSIDADALFHDEVDLSNQKMLGLFQSRLQGSSIRITQKFSTPTYYGYGIDQAYNSSDQHEYMLRCSSCNHWQVPDLKPQFLCLPGLTIGESDTIDYSSLSDATLEKIDFSGSYVRCEKCSAKLDLANPHLREWVAKFPARRGSPSPVASQ